MIVERTFAWLMTFRRLAMDNKKTTECVESYIYIGMIIKWLKILINSHSFLAFSTFSSRLASAVMQPLCQWRGRPAANEQAMAA
jgi:hypothetical protein